MAKNLQKNKSKQIFVNKLAWNLFKRSSKEIIFTEMLKYLKEVKIVQQNAIWPQISKVLEKVVSIGSAIKLLGIHCKEYNWINLEN